MFVNKKIVTVALTSIFLLIMMPNISAIDYCFINAKNNPITEKLKNYDLVNNNIFRFIHKTNIQKLLSIILRVFIIPSFWIILIEIFAHNNGITIKEMSMILILYVIITSLFIFIPLSIDLFGEGIGNSSFQNWELLTFSFLLLNLFIHMIFKNIYHKYILFN